MSFYGNRYVYKPESFAKIVLKNSGINRYLTSPNDDFQVLPKDSTVWIDAESRSDGIGIQSGNHWIKLAHAGDAMQIWHNSPATDSSLKFVPQMDMETNKPSGVGDIVTQLNFDNYLSVPIIRYDIAGHVVDTNNVLYFKMPSDPTQPVKEDIAKIQATMTKIQADQTAANESMKNINTAFSNWSTKIETAETNAASALETANTAKSTADSATTIAAAASSAILNFNTTIARINERLKALDGKDG